MPISIKHSFVSPKADGTSVDLLQPSHWNAEHDISGIVTSVNTIAPDINGNVSLPLDFAPALTSDENYVTDAQLVVINNTSGTNTGDQDLSGKGSLDAVQTWTKGQAGEVTVLTSTAGSIAIDLSDSNNFSHTFTENTTLAAPSNPVAGQSGIIALTQHASSPKTLAYNTFWKFAGGTIPSVTATNSAVDLLTYYVIDSGKAICNLIKGVA